MGAIELAKAIRSVTWQRASHNDMLANRLGAKIAGKPRRSISRAISSVARRRPGTATRLTAGSAAGMAFPPLWAVRRQRAAGGPKPPVATFARNGWFWVAA